VARNVLLFVLVKYLVHKIVLKSLKKVKLEVWLGGRNESRNVEFIWNICVSGMSTKLQNGIICRLFFPDVILLSYLNLLNYSRIILRGFPCTLCSHVLIVENVIQGVLSSAPALASKKRGAANTRRKSESAGTNKKTVANSNNVASVPKQPRQRRESSKDKSQTAPSLATATQRRSSMGQSRKKETLRSATENKRATARRKVCSECDNSRKRRLFCNYSSLHEENVEFQHPIKHTMFNKSVLQYTYLM